MKIGIDASHAFLPDKTGIEEYSFRLIENIAKEDKVNSYILYLREKPQEKLNLPDNFKLKILPWPLFWTQIRLSLHFLKSKNRPDVYFSPAYTLPPISPEKTIVTIHGLEFIKTPESYSSWHNFYHNLTTKLSLRKATSIITVSNNTKKDLIKNYQADPEKINVVYNGFTKNEEENLSLENLSTKIANNLVPYFLFVSRIEKRKNVQNIVKAFNLFKNENHPHKLILAGSAGTIGYEEIKKEIDNSPFKKDIIETGYVTDKDKFILLKHANAFIFPSLYEGFGLPVLEALQYNTPVITSNVSSLPEVGGNAALYVNPKNYEEIFEKMNQINNNKLPQNFPALSQQQVNKFSWKKCAKETLQILTRQK